MEWIRFAITTVCVLTGLFVCCVGVYGVFRFDYAANRMHAAALNDTLGLSACLIGFAVSAPDFFTAMKILLVVVFLWLSAPVSSHLLCRLEVETNEERGEYMHVHELTLGEERALAAAQAQASAAGGGALEADGAICGEVREADGEEEDSHDGGQ